MIEPASLSPPRHGEWIVDFFLVSDLSPCVVVLETFESEGSGPIPPWEGMAPIVAERWAILSDFIDLLSSE